MRASSTTIGTTHGPSAASLSKPPSMRTKAIVVLISLAEALTAKSAWAFSAGTGIGAPAISRLGIEPPSASRCDCR